METSTEGSKKCEKRKEVIGGGEVHKREKAKSDKKLGKGSVRNLLKNMNGTRKWESGGG